MDEDVAVYGNPSNRKTRGLMWDYRRLLVDMGGFTGEDSPTQLRRVSAPTVEEQVLVCIGLEKELPRDT